MNRFLLPVFFVLASFVAFYDAVADAEVTAVDVAGINRVLRKAQIGEVLNSADLDEIDAFVKDGFEALLLAEGRDQEVEVRTTITSKINVDAGTQYIGRFESAVLEEAQDLFGRLKEANGADGFDIGRPETGTLSDEKKESVAENLLILLWRFPSAANINIAIAYMQSRDVYLRYWALKNATNEKVLSQLTAEPSQYRDEIEQVLEAAKKALALSDNIDTLVMIARLGNRLPGEDANQLFAGVIDKRLQSYRDWEVKNEIQDTALLKMLAGEIEDGSAGMVRQEAAAKFAQLYSFIMQKYIMARDFLSSSSVQGLESVMVEIEQSQISILLDMPQSGIKKAIEQDNIEALQNEHDLLLGSAGRRGELSKKLNFDYDSPDPAAPEKLELPEKYKKLIDEQQDKISAAAD